jgi:MFS transporter, OPA family, glycerol-3-phosphate transporter
MIGFFKPAKHIKRMPEEKIAKSYSKLRLQVFLGVFIGYAGYYLVRKNFSIAMPYLEQQGFTKGQLGVIFTALSIAYGLSKFLMGSVSDRSNPKYFLVAGLLMSAIVSIIFGTVPYVTTSIVLMFVLLFVLGWVQGMGWPPCGRTMVHWFSPNERGTKMAIWNVAHNVGGGLIGPLAIAGIAIFGSWYSIFYFPGMIVVLVAILVFVIMKDTPQSVGLPPIEEYRNDYLAGDDEDGSREEELSAKEIFFKHVLNNKFLWFIAIANIFVYFIRYGIIDWAPTYLHQAKGFTVDSSSWSYFLYEYAGIPGTLLCGWISDKVFKGRRAAASILFMFGVMIFMIVYWQAPAGSDFIINLSLIGIGFLIYGPVMLIGVHALDLVPKKAAGTAAGLTGLCGYFFGTTFADAGIGFVVDGFGWKGGFILLIASSILAMFFLALTWNAKTAITTD